MIDLQKRTAAIESEQYVLGALMLQNDVLDRIPELQPEHFYLGEHRAIYAEMLRQIIAGKTCDAITLMEAGSCEIAYLVSLTANTPSTANIARHAATVIDRAIKRALQALGAEITELAAESQQDSAVLIDEAASKLDTLAIKRLKQDPVLLSDALIGYTEVLTARMEGKIKPIATGFDDLDRRLDGGFERGTLTVVAARPGMGKSAFGLALGLNVAQWGSALFLSMEMSKHQVHDRNIAALGKLPISWLRKPADLTPQDRAYWDAMTVAFGKAHELNFHIDDQTSLNILEIRAKSRQVKRKASLDLLIVDQLSFIVGGRQSDKKLYEQIGEHTRGLLALAKELDIAVVLLCQLNRNCEDRTNKRPILSDLALSGSIEQDSANVLFLYRDEIYNMDSPDKGLCEVICAKQRQGEPGIVRLQYIGSQTRFASMEFPYQPVNSNYSKRKSADHL